MTGWMIILLLLCAGAVGYIVYLRRQLAQWRAYLRAVREEPQRKLFVKGNGILAELNFELNTILAEHREQLARLERAEAANRRLLTDLSHDVRTPLASLTGYLEALRNRDTVPREEYIQVAYRKALDLQMLIDMLFQWFKLESREQLYQMEVCDINELTRELLIGYLPQWEAGQISFEADISDMEWLVQIDRAAYARVLGNILGNAVRHGSCTRITVTTACAQGRVRIAIANNGDAIPEGSLPFIFDRLYKCDEARGERGNGLGLAIARELVRAMAGEINAASVPDGETVFSLTFPLWDEGTAQN
ncbi:MAG: HAMP domain-containing histidine kinase [Roseburia sp.]|nr:HAMP domain-containing histidine kinase [Roseburia sp.]